MGRTIQVVLGVVFNPDAQVLIAQRQAHQALAHQWEFPGGKIEANETPLQALQRELHEEVGITLIEPKPLITHEHLYENDTYVLNVWYSFQFQGQPHGKEGQPIQWVKINDLEQIEFPEANLAIVEAIYQLLDKYQALSH